MVYFIFESAWVKFRLVTRKEGSVFNLYTTDIVKRMAAFLVEIKVLFFI